MVSVKLWGLPVVKIHSIFFQLNLTLLGRVIAKIPHKMDLIEFWTKKSSCFFRIKSRITNTQWHPEGIDGWCYYRLWENFWSPFGVTPGGNLDPIWAPPKYFFYLILQEFCDFSGTWDLYYLIFLSKYFWQKF